VFISYVEGVKAYRILDPVTRHVRMTQDVIFDEGHDWDWSKETNDSMMASSSEFTIDYAELEGFRGVGDSPSAYGLPTPCSQDAFTGTRLHSTRCTNNFFGTRWLMHTHVRLTLRG
jgi:hypothetical protein